MHAMERQNALSRARLRIVQHFLSWLALLLLAGHGVASAKPEWDAPHRSAPVSIEARPLQAVIAQLRGGDIAKVARAQSPDKPKPGAGDPPLPPGFGAVPDRVVLPAPGHARARDAGAAEFAAHSYHARAPPQSV